MAGEARILAPHVLAGSGCGTQPQTWSEISVATAPGSRAAGAAGLIIARNAYLLAVTFAR